MTTDTVTQTAPTSAFTLASEAGANGRHRTYCGDNLESMTALSERGEQFDFVLLDPPYNTGTDRSTYRNTFNVEAWIQDFTDRVRLAWSLMDPEASVMLITIDERSLAPALSSLAAAVPEDAHRQIVTVKHSPAGQSQRGFRRTAEYLIFVHRGSAAPQPRALGPWWGVVREGSRATAGKVRWNSLLKTGAGHVPESSPGCFYPIELQINQERTRARVVGIGEPVDWRDPDALLADQPDDDRRMLLYPVRADGTLGRWRVGSERAKYLLGRGLLKPGRLADQRTPLSYACSGLVEMIDSGEVEISGFDEVTGAAQLADRRGIDQMKALPGTIWDSESHSYSTHGSWLLKKFLPNREFSHPKSLYVLEDALAFYLQDKPRARVLDAYAGSGTCAHALMLLNASDGGQRSSVSITLNEIGRFARKRAAAQQRQLAAQDGDYWQVLVPRLQAALTGVDHRGNPVEGSYRFPDRGPFSAGLPGTLEVAEAGPQPLRDETPAAAEAA